MSEFLYSCVNLIFDIKEYGLYFLKFFVYMLCVHVCVSACMLGVLGRSGDKDDLCGDGLRPERHEKFKKPCSNIEGPFLPLFSGISTDLLI